MTNSFRVEEDYASHQARTFVRPVVPILMMWISGLLLAQELYGLLVQQSATDVDWVAIFLLIVLTLAAWGRYLRTQFVPYVINELFAVVWLTTLSVAHLISNREDPAQAAWGVATLCMIAAPAALFWVTTKYFVVGTIGTLLPVTAGALWITGWNPQLGNVLSSVIIASILSVSLFVNVRKVFLTNHRLTLRIIDLAEHDGLSGLWTRQQWYDRTGEAFAGAPRGADCTVMYLDIDRFKDVNDRHGHHVGDALIRALAVAIRRHLPDRGIAGRFGGEEFVISLANTPLDDAIGTAAAIQKEFAGGLDALPSTTVSIGVALHAPHVSLETTVSQADAAMLRAKQLGRNRIEIHQPMR